MTAAWLFPGQGALEARMGLALAARFEPAAALLELASECTGVDARRLLARGGPDLERTEVLQPISTAVTLGAACALRARGFAPDVVAGHSLGELAAWSVAGALEAADTVRLAAARGRAMASATTSGGMLALVGVTEGEVEKALELGRRHGMMALAAHNAPDEWVLAGDEPALGAVAAGPPSVRLRVAGPWHSPAMASAAEQFFELASQLDTRPLTVPLMLAASVELTESSSDFARESANLLVRPIRWASVMQALRAGGVIEVVICGPGKVLASLVRRNLGSDVRVLNATDLCVAVNA